MSKVIELMNGTDVSRALNRLSFEIIEKTHNPENLVLVGIKTRGIPMARMLAEKIKEHAKIDVPVCHLDITFYRDDLSKLSETPKVKEPSFDVDINGKEIVLVDDVLYTGRTIRAAIEAVFSQGRPGLIRLAVLVDRGHRELPIKPDYIGKNVPTSHREIVKVCFDETGDGKIGVDLLKMDE